MAEQRIKLSSLVKRVEVVAATWIGPMNICGTVMCPWARATICSRLLASRLTSISVNATPFRDSSFFAAVQYGQYLVV
jgi:hypothetical protein